MVLISLQDLIQWGYSYPVIKPFDNWKWLLRRILLAGSQSWLEDTTCFILRENRESRMTLKQFPQISKFATRDQNRSYVRVYLLLLSILQYHIWVKLSIEMAIMIIVARRTTASEIIHHSPILVWRAGLIPQPILQMIQAVHILPLLLDEYWHPHNSTQVTCCFCTPIYTAFKNCIHGQPLSPSQTSDLRSWMAKISILRRIPSRYRSTPTFWITTM